MSLTLFSTLVGLILWGAPSQSPAQGSAGDLIIERALDPYLTHERYRDQAERVELSAERGEVWILESLERGDLDRKVCDGARWLIQGRLKRSRGAREAFVKLPALRELSLIFYKAKTKVDPNLEGRYVQTRSAVSTARFTLSRERAIGLNPERAIKMLEGAQCFARAQELLDDLWVSPKVMEEREALSAIEARLAPTKPKAGARSGSPKP